MRDTIWRVNVFRDVYREKSYFDRIIISDTSYIVHAVLCRRTLFVIYRIGATIAARNNRE